MLVHEIKHWGKIHKRDNSGMLKQRLDTAREKLKLTDAFKGSKLLLYYKQDILNVAKIQVKN